MTQRVGLVPFWKNYDRELNLKAVRLADELGYDSFWLPEAWGHSVFPLLAEMAAQTERIKLGTGIVNAFSRTPGLMAMEAATLDEISGGRFILGIGTSGARVIEGFHGRKFEKPLTQVRDVIRVVRALLAGQNLKEAGAKLNDYRPFTLAFEPHQPRIPIYVAALKQKSITSIGELADGWIPTFWPYDRMGDARVWIEEGAKKAGRDPADIVTAPFAIVLPMGKEAGEKKAKELISFYIGGMGDYYKQLLTDFGYAEECKRVDELYRDKKTREKAPDHVSDEMMRALTISGDPQQCLEDLRRLGDNGIDLPIINLPAGLPWELTEAFIRALAPGT